MKNNVLMHFVFDNFNTSQQCKPPTESGGIMWFLKSM